MKISKMPLNKRCDKNVAYPGGLVGVTLEIDMSTIKRPRLFGLRLDATVLIIFLFLLRVAWGAVFTNSYMK